MTERNEVFARLTGRVDWTQLADRFVVIVGVGSVGSTMAVELAARCGVGHMALVDGDRLEPSNLARHALDERYLWANKAEGVADMLSWVPGLDVGALNRHIDATLTDRELDALLRPAHLIVIATDERTTQRRVAERALALDIPAVVPGLYAGGGGEIFVQLGPAHPCFLCWDDFRAPNAEARGVNALNADAFDVIQRAIYLCLALLVPESPDARDIAPVADDDRPRQVFVLAPAANLMRAPLDRRPDCPACRVGPSPLNDMPQRRPRSAVEAFMTASTRPTARDWSFVLRTTARPVLRRVEVSERVVLEGGSVTLSWSAENATHVELEGHGELTTSGQIEAVVMRSTVFRLTAVSPLGRVTAVSPVVRTVPLPQVPPMRLAPLSPSPIVPLSGSLLSLEAMGSESESGRKVNAGAPIGMNAPVSLWPTVTPPPFAWPQQSRMPHDLLDGRRLPPIRAHRRTRAGR